MDLSFLFTINGMLAMALISLIGGYLFIELYKKMPSKEVLLLRPRDMRGLHVPVTKETDIGLTCKKVKGVPRAFLKAGPAWTFAKGGKITTRFLGIEGTAYTAVVKSGKKIISTLAETVHLLWGDDFYSKIPKKQKDQIEKTKWGVTVEVEKVRKDDDTRSTDIHQDDDETVLSAIAKVQKSTKKAEIYQFLIGLAIGLLGMYLIIGQGWM